MKLLLAILLAPAGALLLFLGFLDGDTDLIYGGVLCLILVPILVHFHSKEMQQSQREIIQRMKDEGLKKTEDWYNEEKKQKLSKALKQDLEFLKESAIENINDFKIGDRWKPSDELKLKISAFEKFKIQEQVISFLKKEKTKLPASDIDFQLKIGDLDLVKEACEEMYRDKKIGRTGNYRYFV
tara:strand:- start:1098 stop:1646 length:549 start_codon:yes stop_codon:yes gene_type:complete